MNKQETNITISTQIISACLTMITVVGAFMVFIIEKRDIEIEYYILSITSFLSFVVSIFLGGKGIGDKSKKKKQYFNGQAISALLGVLLFVISIFFSGEKPNETKKVIEKNTQMISQIDALLRVRENQIEDLKKQVHFLEFRIKSIEKDTVSN